METILNFLPAILPIVIPPLVGVVRKQLGDLIPAKYIPMALGLGGALIGGLAGLVGVEAGDLATAGIDAWNGAIIGLASVGVHQLYKKTTEETPPA